MTERVKSVESKAAEFISLYEGTKWRSAVRPGSLWYEELIVLVRDAFAAIERDAYAAGLRAAAAWCVAWENDGNRISDGILGLIPKETKP